MIKVQLWEKSHNTQTLKQKTNSNIKNHEQATNTNDITNEYSNYNSTI
jgi:hypothetical protein